MKEISVNSKQYVFYLLITELIVLKRLSITKIDIKGLVQCFSMQVVMNKSFLLNPKKNLAQICLVVFENAKNALFNSKNDITEPKARLF